MSKYLGMKTECKVNIILFGEMPLEFKLSFSFHWHELDINQLSIYIFSDFQNLSKDNMIENNNLVSLTTY